jgi:thioredoxin-related protein
VFVLFIVECAAKSKTNVDLDWLEETKQQNMKKRKKMYSTFCNEVNSDVNNKLEFYSLVVWHFIFLQINIRSMSGFQFV